MKFRRLGHSGLKVSELCLGTWINFGDKIRDEVNLEILNAAMDLGINFIDTADIYAAGKAEELLGRWMRGRDRRELVIATKCRLWMWNGPNGVGASRKHILDACHDSLRRLGTDYIDLYQIHWPDPETPHEETLRTLDSLVRQGKIRYYGWSNYTSEEITECARICEALGLNKPISLQSRYNMLDRHVEKRDTPACQREGLGQIPWSPLAQGVLTDKYLGGDVPAGARGETSDHLRDELQRCLPTARALGDFAQARGWTLAQLALAWLLAQPTMTAPIVGATSVDQLTANAKAVDIALSAEDLAGIEGILGAGAEGSRE